VLTRPLVRPVHYQNWCELEQFIRDHALQGEVSRAREDIDWRGYLFSGLASDQVADLVARARAVGAHVFHSLPGTRVAARVLVVGRPAEVREVVSGTASFGVRVQGVLDMFCTAQGEAPSRWALPGGDLKLDRPLVQAVVNVTPDSFYDGGRYATTERAVARAEQVLEEGADIIDIGGESTRPGADPVTVEEETARVLPVVEALAGRIEAPISVDTSKAVVARRSLEAGARIINDVTGFRGDPEMLDCVAAHGAGVIVMHMRGTPRTMQRLTHYESLMGEIVELLADRVALAEKAGVPRERIVVDPGLGFGKTPEDNLVILRRLSVLTELGCPILVGASRKSFLGRLFGWDLEERLEGSVAAAAAAVLAGASIVRVHDVKETRKVVDTVWAIRHAGSGEYTSTADRSDDVR